MRSNLLQLNATMPVDLLAAHKAREAASPTSKHRQAMRDAGLRPVQLWVPDTRSPEFLEACRQQMRAIAISDANDPTLYAEMEAAIADMDDWVA